MTTMTTGKHLQNENSMHRLIRLMLGMIFFQLGFFWLAGIWQILFYILAGVMVITAIIGFCPLYKALGISTYRENAESLSKVWIASSAAALIVVLVAGSYASHFFSKRIFLENFNSMNAYYKQALFHTGQGNRAEAVENYDHLVDEFAGFRAQYAAYRPYALKGDTQFEADLARVSNIVAGVESEVRAGDLSAAHVALEEVRPVFQDVFKRNGFSMLSVALVDFHDVMEQLLEAANEKDAQRVIAVYPEVSLKLQAVESEANDAEIQAIRQNLEALLNMAENNQLEELPAQAGKLKSSFVKVYLVRG